MTATTVVLLGATDVVARDAAVAGVLLDLPTTAVLCYEHEWVDDHGSAELLVRRRLITVDGTRWEDQLGEGYDCACCCVHDDLFDALATIVGVGDWSGVVVVPPLAAPLAQVAAQLVRDSGATGLELSVGAVIAAVDVRTLHDTLFGDDLLAERGTALSPTDRRSVGEASAQQIEYADLVVGVGPAKGTEVAVLQQLAPGRWFGEWTELPTPALFAPHDLQLAASRTDPLAIVASGPRPDDEACAHPDTTPDSSDDPAIVWTLDLHDPRPFHPDRLLERISDLGLGRIRARGHFWLPSRPHTPCAWDASGGQLSIGALAGWNRTDRGTRLHVTGVHPPDRQRIAEAFDAVLLTDAEQRDAAAWEGRPDGFEQWLGSQAAHPA